MPATKRPPRKSKKAAKSAKPAKPPKAKSPKVKKAARAAAPKVDLKPDQHERLKLFEKKSKEEKAIDGQIIEVERKMVAAAKMIDSTKSELKSLKTQHSTLHNELRQVVRGEGNLFADVNEPKKPAASGDVSNRGLPIIQPGATATPAATTADPKLLEQQEQDAFDAVKIEDLGVKGAALDKLQADGIRTGKDLRTWIQKHPRREIKGVGPSAIDKLGGQMADWYLKRQQEREKAKAEAAPAAEASPVEPTAGETADPQKLPGAEELRSLNNLPASDFTEDAIDPSSRETVANLDNHLTIEVGRRTSGQWQSGYFLTIGKLERSQHLGTGHTFTDRAGAVGDAVTAVGKHLAEANGEITGKKPLAAAANVRAVLADLQETA
jgi:hypothetical protein